MQNDFFKIIKLKTGEVLLCTMASDVKNLVSESHIAMTTPVQVIPHKETRRDGLVIGESFFLRPWIGLSDTEEFIISTDVVMTIGNVKKEIQKQYIQYVDQTVEARNRLIDREERSDAAEALLREITPGEYRIVDDNTIGDFYEERE